MKETDMQMSAAGAQFTVFTFTYCSNKNQLDV